MKKQRVQAPIHIDRTTNSSLTIWNGPPAEEIWVRPSETSTDAQLWASCQAASPPGMATAPPATTCLSRGWYGLQYSQGTLPALQDTYNTQCHRNVKKIILDINHPSHGLFSPLPSRRQGQYRCIQAGTERLTNIFYLKAVRLFNSHQ